MPAIIETFTFLMIAAQAGSFGAGLVAVGATFSGTLLSVGLSVGVSLLSGLLNRQTPPVPKQSDVQANIRQPLSARRRHHGRVKVGSVIVFGFRREQKIYVLHYIGEGPINGYVTHFLDNKPVTLDGNGFVTDSQYQRGGRSRVQILTKIGTMSDGPFDEIIAAFPELDTPSTPFRHRGCAMVLTIFEEVSQEAMIEVYPNNLPAYQVVIDGLSHYDPRVGSPGGIYTDNAGICLLNEVMDVFGLTPSDSDEIDFDAFATFADHCDEQVALKGGGTEPRYRCAGTISLDAENEARIRAVSDVCNAEVYIDRQGRISVRQRMRITPSIALRASNGDHLALSLESGRGLQRQFNTLKGIYVESGLNWKENQAIYQNADDLASDGKEMSETFDIRLCPSGTQAQRLTKMRYFELNAAYVGSLTSGLQALDLIDDHTFTLDLSPEDDFERVFSATNIEMDEATLTVSCGLISYSDGALDWDEDVDERDIIVNPPDLLVELEDVEIEVTPTVAALPNSAPILKFTWDAAPGGTLPDSWSQRLQVSFADDDEWFDATVNNEDKEATFGPVADGAAYDWRIRNIAGGVKFDWQYSSSPVTVLLNNVAPSALISATVTAGVHLGYVQFNFQTSDDANNQRIHIYRVPAGDALDKNTHPRIIINSNPGSSFSYNYGDPTRANIITDSGFDNPSAWTAGLDWSVTGSAAVKVPGAGTRTILQGFDFSSYVGSTLRWTFAVSISAGSVALRLSGSVNNQSAAFTTSGIKLGTIVPASGHSLIGLSGSADMDGSVDDLYAYFQTASCAPQGTWDFHVFPANASGVEGSVATTITNVVIV